MTTSNRRARRATKTHKAVPRSENRRLPDKFHKHFERLAVVGGFAQHVSIAQTGLPTSTSGMLASKVFAKCCAHTRSIGAIAIQSPMFDHHAIMALARMITEGAIMIAYLLENVSEDERRLRHTLLRLHDTAGRIKLMRSYGAPDDDLRDGRASLIQEMTDNACYSTYDDERQQRMLTGEEMFTAGMRAVAAKSLGWDKRQFTGIYSYLSSHMHSGPISFMRMSEHKIDYYNPSDTQLEILHLAMEVAIASHRRALLRMIDYCTNDVSEIYNRELLSEFRKEDAACTFFKPAK